MNLGERIKKTRWRAGLSQREVAKKSHITVSFLSQLENNKAAPSLKSLQNISRALGIGISQLLSEDISYPRTIKVVKKNSNEKIILHDGESLSLRLG